VKRTIGTFHGTGLHEQLRDRGRATLVFGGIATNTGVESTARVAAEQSYTLVFVESAMSALTAKEHEAAKRDDFARFGESMTGADPSPLIRLSAFHRSSKRRRRTPSKRVERRVSARSAINVYAHTISESTSCSKSERRGRQSA
jgi:hypothetical protein